MDRKTFRAMCLANTGGYFEYGRHFIVVSANGKPVRYNRLGNIAFYMSEIQYELKLPVYSRSKIYIQSMLHNIRRARMQ